jgi:hypothetical protein
LFCMAACCYLGTLIKSMFAAVNRLTNIYPIPINHLSF